MKSGGKLLACLVGSLAFYAVAWGAAQVPDTAAEEPGTPSSPYQEIVKRNVFELKDPPPPPNPEDTKPPPSKITLTGIWTIGGKLALMKTPGAAPKPGQQATGERFYTLHIGERDGDIEVVDIDEKAGSVTVLNAGQQEILTFEKNGVKLASTPPPAMPGIPGALPGVPPPPGAMPQPMTAPAGSPGLPTFPRTMRSGASPVTGGVNPAYGTATPGFGAVAPNYGTTAAQQPRVQLSSEEATVLMEVERQRLMNKGNPNAMIIPPTALSPNPAPQNTAPGGVPNPMPH